MSNTSSNAVSEKPTNGLFIDFRRIRSNNFIKKVFERREECIVLLITYSRTSRVWGSEHRFQFLALTAVLILGLSITSCGNSGGGTTSVGTNNGNAVNGAGTGGNSAPGTFSLASPVNNATAVSTLPNLVWTASPGATGYNVQLKIATPGDYIQVASVTALTTNLSDNRRSFAEYDL